MLTDIINANGVPHLCEGERGRGGEWGKWLIKTQLNDVKLKD
jgi:hypothetical protein